MSSIFTKKQWSYPSVTMRLFAVCIDTWLLAVLFWPVMFLAQKFLFPMLLKKHFATDKIDLDFQTYVKGLQFAFASNQQIDYSALYSYAAIVLAINLLLTCTFWLFFWWRMQSSPGKMLFKIKILNAKDLSIPSKRQYVVRMICMVCMPFGILTVPFNKNKQALYDMVAGTVVVKI